MDKVFNIKDKIGKKVYLSSERWKHIQKHPFMNESLEEIQNTLKNPLTIRYEEEKEVLYFYKEFKNNSPTEKYLMVSVKYLNGESFVITSFFTNKVTGIKWKTK